MKRLLTIAVVCMFVVVPARADMFEFDAGDVAVGGTPSKGFAVGTNNYIVSEYMSTKYGSDVTATGAAVWNNDKPAPIDFDNNWYGKTGSDGWLRAYGLTDSITNTPGAFQISFDVVQAQGVSAEYYAWKAPFTVTAYGSGYAENGGDRYNPDVAAQVWTETFGTLGVEGSGSFVSDFTDNPVSLLVFSDMQYLDFAVDNLLVTPVTAPVPIPAALLIGLLGMGTAGIKLRKYA